MKKVKLGEVATFINGYAFKPQDWSSEGKEIIRIQNLTKTSKETNYYSGTIDKKYIIEDGDILISWSGTLGVFQWCGKSAVLNQHIFKVVFDKIDIDKSYFKYVVEKGLQDAVKHTHGSTMKHLTKKYFDNILVSYTNLKEQQRIASELDLLSKLILRRQEQLKELNLLVKSRFNEMFILNDFSLKRLGELVEEVRYGTSLPATLNGKYGYLRMNNITEDGKLNIQNLKYIDIPEKDLEKYVVRKGDVLFNRTNSIELVGKTCIYELNFDMVIAGYIIRIRTNNNILNSRYLSEFLNFPSTKKFLRNIAKGAVNQANINAKELQDISVPLPPLSLQNEFADFVAQVDKSQLAIQKSLEELETLKKSLMQKYFG
ncbi:restriction endonuclease subunit S [Streptococcus mitis]|uniref:Type-1 restriction enzyme EcoKI specificity protein n=1 Tax=Streptococcus mitis TaxID=28037 RepID=A0A3R9KAS7_STRMT|nr:restriction endonuclease subunit S [Streptococcus mitis]RSJ05388.1 Type-1 restriction enzyme EcoKI specificity protein [Streptococcus mitis]